MAFGNLFGIGCCNCDSTDAGHNYSGFVGVAQPCTNKGAPAVPWFIRSITGPNGIVYGPYESNGRPSAQFSGPPGTYSVVVSGYTGDCVYEFGGDVTTSVTLAAISGPQTFTVAAPPVVSVCVGFSGNYGQFATNYCFYSATGTASGGFSGSATYSVTDPDFPTFACIQGGGGYAKCTDLTKTIPTTIKVVLSGNGSTRDPGGFSQTHETVGGSWSYCYGFTYQDIRSDPPCYQYVEGQGNEETTCNFGFGASIPTQGGCCNKGSYGSYGSSSAQAQTADGPMMASNIDRPDDLDEELVIARYQEDTRWAEALAA